MPLEEAVRKELQKAVTRVRTILTEDFTRQCKTIYGIQPDGTFVELEHLGYLSEEEKATAMVLRERLAHLVASEEDNRHIASAVDRMLREQAFTVLNRLCALRMCEERGLVQECVRKGLDSKGFRLFEEDAVRLGSDTFGRYVLYLSLLCDELSIELGILFDRFSSTAVLFPSENALKEALEQLNESTLQGLWSDDETIGWVYQYFNPPEERKVMREASQAPRDSRELAVRNQFFTPRYVVEFLTDNTLGRIWYEIRQGSTELRNSCRYLVRRANEVFLSSGEAAPAGRSEEIDLDQEELLKTTGYIEHRPKKDPRDLRILDPACGSGHFLLYAFDLLERIYEEAWIDPESPKSEATSRTIQEDFESLDELRQKAPTLILEYNLHGIDIDPRAAQIAALALWLRAQKTWKNLGLKSSRRPSITKSNIVTAEPMPGEDAIRRDFTAGLTPRVLGQIVDEVFNKMKLAGEAGSLLKIEEEIKDTITAAKIQWLEGPRLEQAELFPEERKAPAPRQLQFDLSGVTDEKFWLQAEGRILAALHEYAEHVPDERSIRRRLFAEDTARGFAFIDVCSSSYDVVLMNPPFGDASLRSRPYIEDTYGDTKGDVYKAFVECCESRLRPSGMLGVISSRAGFFLRLSEDWRTRVVLRLFRPVLLADLGGGVLDAMVEVAAYVLRRLSVEEDQELTASLMPMLRAIPLDSRQRFSVPKWQVIRGGLKRHQALGELRRLESIGAIRKYLNTVIKYSPVPTALQNSRTPTRSGFPALVCFRLLDDDDKASVLLEAARSAVHIQRFEAFPSRFEAVPGFPFAYWVSDQVRQLFKELRPFASEGREAWMGLSSGSDPQWLRLIWEIPPQLQGRSRELSDTCGWVPLSKGGEFATFYLPLHLLVDWTHNGARLTEWKLSELEMARITANNSKCWNQTKYFRPGLTWSRRSQLGLSVRLLPRGCISGIRVREHSLAMMARRNCLPSQHCSTR